MYPAKMAELIEMPFGMWAQVGASNHVLDEVVGVQIVQGKGQFWEWAYMGTYTVDIFNILSKFLDILFQR